MFESVLVANRGEIACRIIRTLRDLGIRSIAVYSDSDAGARHVRLADVAVRIGPAPAAQSYLSAEAIIVAARQTGATAIHPGYGFLSENADFARACAEAGVVFVGPGVAAIDVMGDKIRAKAHVAARGVPIIPGAGEAGMSDAELAAAAKGVGYPLLIKPSAGGGGKGMTVVEKASDLAGALVTARRVAQSAFGNDALLLERYVDRPRHIEVQVLADRHGNVVHLGERECSLQRRHQKVVEEAPSPLLDSTQRDRMGEAACEVARSVDYVGAGTIEFLVSDAKPDEFFFMEMNTRLQVEHPVTEAVTGIDLVEQQLRIAAGEALDLAQQNIALTGHAVEVRLYSEDPERGFLPAAGTVGYLREATGAGIRVDSALIDGLVVGTDYDPMLAKIIASAADREQALRRLDDAIAETVVLGVRTNREFLQKLVADPDVRAGKLDTGLIERFLGTIEFEQPSNELLEAVAATRAPAADGSAWHDARGWRIGAHRATRFRVIDGHGHEADVQVGDEVVSSDAITLDRGTITWVATPTAIFELDFLTREQQFAAHRLTLTRAPGEADPNIRTPMPGTVIAIERKSGDEVEAGQVLVTIEAMKMEHKLLASVAGVVTIDVVQGDQVATDQVVATISPHKGAAA
ncbi:MAG TPA: biotin carboxylase N-terminal domain-containing protein [Galbitalea sp.]|jgi:acetyl-CoA/propionyl-CoA carboxylase biotin carboxyl carrier protein|nr:biotin carboxylase N-terminal domain-containing protein [Galbitalea sp.]